MNLKRPVTITAILVLSMSHIAIAAEQEEVRFGEIRDMRIVVPHVPSTAPLLQAERPAILPALYATLGGMQAWDIYTTTVAMNVGAHEANTTAASFSGHAGSLVGLKAATTVGTIFFAERMWKKNKVGAIVMLVAVNGATAAVSMHNMRNAKAARR